VFNSIIGRYIFIDSKHLRSLVNVGKHPHLLTILEWIPVLVDTVPLIIWLLYFVLMKNFCCCQRIQQRQSYKLRVHGVNPQSPLKV
jgi:hypothetical protein